MKSQQTPDGTPGDDSKNSTVAVKSGGGGGSGSDDAVAVPDCVKRDHDSDGDLMDDNDDDPGEEHEFEIIDQVESEEELGIEEENEQDSQITSQQANHDIDASSSGDDFEDSELHAMLEKGINREALRTDDRSAPIIKQKIVLKEFESDPFDILPEGWVCVTHNCGMPVYLHKETRVCTMARPYSLGSASARAHDIPVSAIPCLQYRRQLDKESVSCRSVTEGGGGTVREKVPRQVSDCIQDISVEVTSAQPHNHAVPVQTAGQKVSLCPATTDPKPSPQKLWVVSQESSSSCPLESQKEALHTGTGEFSTIDDQAQLLKGRAGACSRGFPQSPEGDNIAVSFDSSSLESSCRDLHWEKASQALCTNNSGTVACGSPPTQSRDMATDDWVDTADIPSLTATSSRECADYCVSAALKEEVHLLEDGEIVDDMSHMTSAEPHSFLVEGKQSVIEVCANPILSCVQQGNIDVSSSNTVGHVVQEEVSSSTEPSELVTSSSNSLATIKRKIESLKNKRGGKLRKLDSAGAVGWPTESNISVHPVQMGTPNAAVSASTNEKLKMHAAEVKIKSAEERARESLLDSKMVHSYCSKLFQFRILEVKKYRSWRERRRHIEERSRRNRPELPPSTKLITCPIPGNLRSEDGAENSKKREFILNPTGKSYLCILHEYMQRTLKIQPLYVFKELENSKTPYGATVTIGNIEYGTGYASSKKVAKQEAAKETLKVLIPDLFQKISDQEIKNNISDLSFFDEIKVTDPRVNDLGNKVGQPSPFQLLLECLRRNFGMGNTQCEVSTKPLKNQKCEFTINVGKHSATVVAKNKREGKQLAAQAILAKLHPHVPSWGSLLRLYATSVEKPVQKPEDMNDIKNHAPNHSVLESLRQEMRKLHQQKEAIQPKGKIIINTKNLPSKMSGVDL